MIQERSRRRVTFRDFGEEGIFCEQKIYPQRTAISCSKPIVLLTQGEIRDPRQILDRKNEVDVPGVPSIHVLEKGKSTDENVWNAVISQSTNQTFRPGEKRFLIHGGFKLMQERVPENRAQVITPSEWWGRWRDGGENHPTQFNP